MSLEAPIGPNGPSDPNRKWFRDSDALIEHGENLAHLMDAITAPGEVIRRATDCVSPATTSPKERCLSGFIWKQFVGSPLQSSQTLPASGVIERFKGAWSVKAGADPPKAD